MVIYLKWKLIKQRNKNYMSEIVAKPVLTRI